MKLVALSPVEMEAVQGGFEATDTAGEDGGGDAGAATGKDKGPAEEKQDVYLRVSSSTQGTYAWRWNGSSWYWG